jgi:uncharacterized protein
MVEVDTILLKIASRCNIDCRYCYVYNMGDTGWSRVPKRISPETCEAVAAALSSLASEQGRPFAVVLHGGEPLLLGATYLGYVVSTLREALPAECAISIQTNGLLISKEILDLCAAARITLSVSLDGPRHVHDRNRIGFTGAGTFDNVLEGIRLLRAHPSSEFLFTGLLAVVDPESDPNEVYAFFKGLRPPSVDFIYRDGNHSRLPKGKASTSTTEYGQWMAALLDVYMADSEPIRIRILDDIIKLVLGGLGSKDGVGITDYGVIVIDTDGSVTKNDTLKSSFDGADRFPEPWSIHTHNLNDIVRSTDFAEYQAMQRPSSPICLTCPELRVCGGGMTLQRWRDSNGYDNPSVYCEDQKLLIGHIRATVASLGVVI